MTLSPRARSTVSAVFLALGAGVASAAPSDEPAAVDRVDVDADRVTLVSGRTVRFEGGVRLRRGDASLSCRLLVAELSGAGALQRARAEGDVRVVVAGVVASAPRAEVDLAAGTVVLSGGVVIDRGDVRFEGESVTLRLDGGEVVIRRARGRFRLYAPAPSRDAPP